MLVLVFSADVLNAQEKDPIADLQIIDVAGGKSVALCVNGKKLIVAENLWKIGVGWENEAPKKILNANAQKVETLSDCEFILSGNLQVDNGTWTFRDVYERVSPTTFKCTRRATFSGKENMGTTTVINSFSLPTKTTRAVLPSYYYYGNPSGVKNTKNNVVRLNYTDAPLILCEEHRLPMPFVMAEFEIGQDVYATALHTIPSPVPHAKTNDTWWTLGLGSIAKAINSGSVIGNTELISASGFLAGNGNNGVVKSGQRIFETFQNAHMDIPSKAIVEKIFFIQAYPVEKRGDGLGLAVKQSLDIFKPYATEEFPSKKDIISKKLRFGKSRWIDDGDICGFDMYPTGYRKTRPHITFGWCGQAAAIPLGLQMFSNDASDLQKVQRALDFLTTTKFDKNGFAVVFSVDKKQWIHQFTRAGNPDWLSQGQGMDNVAMNIAVARKSKKLNSKKWEDFLKRAADFHSDRVLARDWLPISTSEAFLVSPLVRSSKLFENEKFAKAALKIADFYAEKHLSMDTPYWGGTLDARCEDKEGAWAAMQAFLAVYELSGDKKYLDYTRHALDVVLTYTYVWDVSFNASRLADVGFKTRGWTSVSVQNNHLDVYGVRYAYKIQKLGEYLKIPEYTKLAEVMYRSCGQLIDIYGSQGEQMQQTNFGQHDKVELSKIRGGYVENWSVLWITAHFLVGVKEAEIETIEN